jgi:hypothetical protein
VIEIVNKVNMINDIYCFINNLMRKWLGGEIVSKDYIYWSDFNNIWK